MKNISAVFLLFASSAFCQTPDPNPTPTSTTLPLAFCGFASFNQLGDPRFAGGVCAIYPVVGSIGIYGTTVADILPKKQTDPNSGRSFYNLSISTRQGFHKSIFSLGQFTFLLGGEVGPSFSSGQPSGVNVSLTGSFTATSLFRISPIFSLILPVRMLYINGAGFNPIVELGIVANLKSSALKAVKK